MALNDLKHETIDKFTLAYIEAALWATCDNSDEKGGEPLEQNYSINDFSQKTLSCIIEDCKKFQANNDLSDYPSKNAGHDFFFTRNHHGCGFWDNDFGTKEQCNLLTKAAHEFGTFDIYVGDDGKLYA